MDITYIILCPSRNLGGLKNTIGSIRFNTTDRKSICIIADDVIPDELKEFSEVCETHVGGNTLTSLINLGMKKAETDWVFILFAGSRITKYLENKLITFARRETDVLFPVVDYKGNFVDGSFNGVLINAKFFELIGDFPTNTMRKQGSNDFEMAKRFWHADAVKKGGSFKAIVGMKVI